MEPNKSREINLLQKYLEGTITEPESIELFAFLKNNPVENNTEFEVLLKDIYYKSFAENPALSTKSSKDILDKLLVSTAYPAMAYVSSDQMETPVHQVSFLRSKWFQYVAAAALTIFTSLIAIELVTNKYKKNQFPQIVGNLMPAEIPPGTNSAVLTLGNGKEIFLDSLHGNTVSDKQFKVNIENGKLEYESKAELAEYHKLSTPRGGQYQLKLPDGTGVWLNAASSISYPTAFNDDKRKVTITGEVYFEVATDKSKPFIVDMPGKSAIEVLGTSFNVNAYNDEPGINTTLLEGAIKMITGQQTAFLKPGQQAKVAGEQIKVIDNANLEMTMAWRNGSFQFGRTNIDEVLRQFARWYGVDVVFEKDIPDIKFSGAIKRDLNLSQALFVLEKMGVRFRIEGKKLIVLP